MKYIITEEQYDRVIGGDSLAWVKPKIQNSDGLAIYDDPIEGHTYVITVDTSRGQGKDYSAFCVIDITDPPYKVVAKYRNNLISPMVYPDSNKCRAAMLIRISFT